MWIGLTANSCSLATNATATHDVPTVFFLSFGPMLLGAVVGAAMGIRRRAGHLAVLGLIVVVSLFFYFLVDVRDHQHVYVGWRAGHLMFIAFAPLVGFAVQELWSGGRLTRLATFAVGGLLALAA